MEIYYLSSTGEKLVLSEFPVAVTDVTQLYGREWEEEAEGIESRNKSRLSFMYRTEKEFDLDIAVFADSHDEFNEIMNRMEAITDYDCANSAPGKLYVGVWYLPCFIKKTEAEEYEELLYSTDVTFTIYSANPFWIKESLITCEPSESQVTEGGYDYLYDFPYDYFLNYNPSSLTNESHVGADFIITIYGYCTDPQIIIGDWVYGVEDVELKKGETLVINSAEKTIVKVSADGTTENMFSKRLTDFYIFEKIPSGEQIINWQNAFTFEIKLLQPRSEPKWI